MATDPRLEAIQRALGQGGGGAALGDVRTQSLRRDYDALLKRWNYNQGMLGPNRGQNPPSWEEYQRDHANDPINTDQLAEAPISLWEQLAGKYAGVGPEEQASLDRMSERGKGGLTAADKAAFLEAKLNADTMAKGREGAIAQDALTRGGGVGTSGLQSVMQAQAAQASAGRANQADTMQAGYASNRSMAADQAFQEQMARNRAMQNQFNMGTTAGQAGAYGHYLDYRGAQDESQRQAEASKKGPMDYVIGGLGAIGSLGGLL